MIFFYLILEFWTKKLNYSHVIVQIYKPIPRSLAASIQYKHVVIMGRCWRICWKNVRCIYSQLPIRMRVPTVVCEQNLGWVSIACPLRQQMTVRPLKLLLWTQTAWNWGVNFDIDGPVTVRLKIASFIRYEVHFSDIWLPMVTQYYIIVVNCVYPNIKRQKELYPVCDYMLATTSEICHLLDLDTLPIFFWSQRARSSCGVLLSSWNLLEFLWCQTSWFVDSQK